MKAFFLAVLVVAASSPLLLCAEETKSIYSCPKCGCCNLKKCCKLVPEVKKVPKTVYDCKCEDFCVPGKSKCLGTKCVKDCDGCHEEKVWQPNCGCVRTRTVLVKKTEMVEKCGFKCVVETVCTRCGCNCAAGPCVDEAPAKPAP